MQGTARRRRLPRALLDSNSSLCSSIVARPQAMAGKESTQEDTTNVQKLTPQRKSGKTSYSHKRLRVVNPEQALYEDRHL